MSIFDLPDIIEILWISIIVFFTLIFGYVVNDLVKRSGKKLSDYIVILFYRGIEGLLLVPRLIKKYFMERKIAYFLKDQVIILADSDRSKRRDANQKIANSLSNQLGCEAAIKWKIDRILIHYLTSDLDDTKRFAIENLERLFNNSDYQKIVSSELIKGLIVNLSEDSEIRDQSKTLLHRIIINHFGKIFIDSIDSGISEFSALLKS